MVVEMPNGSPRRCLITGTTGFIGSHLGRVLSRLGWEVTALARATSDRSGLGSRRVRWVVGDVTDPSSLRSALEGQPVVFHCAGLTKALRPDALMRVNAAGTRNLMVASAALATPPERIVVLSSQAAAGPSLPDGQPRSELDEPAPVSDYGRSKLEGERACEEFRGRLPITILRPVVVYGPRERDLYTIFKSLARGPFLFEVGSRPVTFQAIHSHDLVGAMLATVRAESDRVVGRTFFVGHPRAWTSEGFGWEIARSLGREEIRVVRVPWWLARRAASASGVWARLRSRPGVLSGDKLREFAAGSWICRTEAFQEATGFRPRFDAPEGLRATAQWYRRHGWI